MRFVPSTHFFIKLNTVSLAAGTKPLVVLPEYAEHTRSTGSVGIYDRSGEARS